MKIFSKILCLTLVGLFYSPLANAGNVTVGSGISSLNDWGISFNGTAGNVDWGTLVDVTPGDASFYEDSHTTSSGFSYKYAIEDFVGSGGFVGPRYGGQNYDAEFLGVGVDTNSLVIALVSGQRPDNGNPNYAPGDLYISTDKGVFGVELTGQTFFLDGSGHTDTFSSTGAGREAGTIWKDATWIEGVPDLTLYPIGSALRNVQIDHESTDLSKKVGSSSAFYFSGDTIGTQHSVFELSIDLSVFEGATITGVHWSPSCGNDLLYPSTNITTAPEPASAALFGLGLFGLGGFVRRKKKHQTTPAS